MHAQLAWHEGGCQHCEDAYVKIRGVLTDVIDCSHEVDIEGERGGGYVGDQCAGGKDEGQG